MGHVPVTEVTPLLIEEVATHCGTSLFQASTWPPEPVPKKEEVATAVGTALAPVLLARTELAAMEARPMVALEPPTSAPAPTERVSPLLPVRVVVATLATPA